MLERTGLSNIPELSIQESQEVIFGMARNFAALMDLDFDKDILPGLKNEAFWDVDYLKDSKWGLSIMDAYRCLVDVHRTTQIMGGIKETVASLKASGKDQIYAIDAGTGTGIFSVYLASLGVDKVFALEFNEQTAQLAEKFIASYGFSDRVKVLVGDATNMDIPELRNRPADILVSENLSGGLFAEPQFQIIRHLSNFLTPDAPIIPYGAELSVSLARGDWNSIDWKGKDPRKVIAERRVPNVTVLTNKVHYSSVQSTPGMAVPRITADIVLNSNDDTPANTLLISTIFQINNTGKIYKLESDSAEFLGKTIAIELPSEIKPENGIMHVNFLYDAGFGIKNSPEGLTVNGSSLELKGLLS